jgi:hypothetical protein
MADNVTSQLYDGAHHVVLNINSVSDGTGQAGVVILDPSTLIPNPGTHLVLWRCSFDIKGGSVNIEWDGSPDRNLVALTGDSERDFSKFGGIGSSGVAIQTGLIRLTTLDLWLVPVILTLEFEGGPTGPGGGAFSVVLLGLFLLMIVRYRQLLQSIKIFLS